MEAKLNRIVNEYAESKINSEETSKRLDARHVLNIHTLEDKYNKLLKAKVDENNKLTKNLYGLKMHWNTVTLNICWYGAAGGVAADCG